MDTEEVGAGEGGDGPLEELEQPEEEAPEEEAPKEERDRTRLPMKDGRVLTLRPVNENTCRAIIEKMGGMRLFLSGDIADLPDEEQKAYITNTIRFARYLTGWGVVEDPSEEEIETLQALGLDSDIPNLRRAAWLMYLIYDELTLTQLTSNVLFLTWRAS